MANTSFAGLVLVLAGGIAQGAFMAPTKWIRKWAWENYWLVFSLTSYLIVPWLLAFLTIPRLLDVYANCCATDIILVGIFGSAWGVGAVTFGLGVEALGVALGFAIILGVATTVGTLIPLFVMTPPNFSSKQLLFTVLALAIMLLGRPMEGKRVLQSIEL